MTTESAAVLLGALAALEGVVIVALLLVRLRTPAASRGMEAANGADRVATAAAIDSRIMGGTADTSHPAGGSGEAAVPDLAASGGGIGAIVEATGRGGEPPAGGAWSAVRRDATAPDAAADLLVDRLTGLDSSLVWEQTIREEARRFARYGRPVALVVAELTGIDRVVDQLGQPVADRVVSAVADTLRRNARSSDRIARIGTGRFALLLPETDEILAINYVERVRAASDRWLEASAVALRLSAGWSNPTPGGDLSASFRLAVERMYADRTPGEATPSRRRSDTSTP